MKITIDRNNHENSDSQFPIVTIDLENCNYPYAIRNALKLALETDGYDKATIETVFNEYEDKVSICEGQ